MPPSHQVALYLLLLLIAVQPVMADPIEFENGDVYDGLLVNGQRTGKGVYQWANGNRYEGDFLQNRMHGQGVFTLATGDRYEGEFNDDQMNGQGVFTWPNGRRYEGEFINNGERTGRGEFTSPNGNRYYGDFLAGRLHGLGVFHWRDGTVFRGQFRDSKIDGYGVKEQPDQTLELQQWSDGILISSTPLIENERCRLQLENRAWMFHSDSCVNGLAHGRGLAASLDGKLIAANSHVVLGNLIKGDLTLIRFDGDGQSGR